MDGSISRRRDDSRGPGALPAAGAEVSDSPADIGQQRVLRRFIGAVLTVYWATLFVITHVPLPEGPMQIPGADKVVHFVGYGVLGLLLAFWVALRRVLSARVAVVTVLLLATYGAVDELLQIPVGRSCEFADWVCDLFGSAGGVLVIVLLSRFHPRVHPGPGPQNPAESPGR
ncbi:MAG: VanZ family protein [Planctomycetaceae bacterium]